MKREDAAARATILMYHRLCETIFDPEEALYTLSPNRFREQMDVLAEEGRPVVGLDRLLDGRFPDGATVLTFDDGCTSDVSVALPALLSRGFEATFFVNPEKLGRPGFLDWDGLETLLAAGMRVGSHGLDHRLFDGMETAELERQLGESKARLEERLGVEVAALALPGGSGATRAPGIARRFGYRAVFGSEPGLATRNDLEALLPRIAVRRSDSLARFRAIARQSPLPLIRAKARRGLLKALKAVVGPRVYEGARRRLGTEAGGKP